MDKLEEYERWGCPSVTMIIVIFVDESPWNLEDIFQCFGGTCYLYIKTKEINSIPWIRERTIPTEGPQLVGEISANFCG
jgi:hypothetical protein